MIFSHADLADLADYSFIQLSQAPLALKIKGDRRRQKEIKDISFVAL